MWVGTSCGSRNARTMRFDGSLRCASRLHAQAMNEQGFTGATGPDEVTYLDRVMTAGYASGAVQVLFPADATSEEIDVVIEENCLTLFDPDMVVAGVGAYEDSWIVLVGQ